FSVLYISLMCFFSFFFHDTATTDIYTLSLHDALPILISKLFADDYKAYNAVDYKLYPMLMQKSLDSLCSWSDTWQLDLALSKCGSLMLASGTKYVDENDLIVGDHVLSTFDTIIDLGVTIDCDLRFAKHIKHMVSKARQRIFFIFKSFLVH